MNKRILVADDDQPILEAVQLLLEMEGYQVDSLHDCSEINSHLAKRPDLLLLDIWLSGIDGRNICKTLKENAATRDIPVVMISASTNVAQSAKEAGADGFLPKPFEMNDLLSIVKKYA